MQTPNKKTAIPRCLALASYSARMMSKFPSNQVLVGLGVKITAAAGLLHQANLAYEASKQAIIEARVEVKYIDFFGDDETHKLLRRAELADGGKPGGPIHTALAPKGKTPLVKPFGQSQVAVLKDLEGRIQATAAMWPEAAGEQAAVQKIREDYEGALGARDAAWQSARNLRVARNVARDQFVLAYVDATLEVKQLFPRDSRMQELFFDEVEKDQNEPEASPEPATEPVAGPPDGAPGG